MEKRVRLTVVIDREDKRHKGTMTKLVATLPRYTRPTQTMHDASLMVNSTPDRQNRASGTSFDPASQAWRRPSWDPAQATSDGRAEGYLPGS